MTTPIHSLELGATRTLAAAVALLLTASSCGASSDALANGTTTEATASSTVSSAPPTASTPAPDERFGAPDRSQAEPWPEKFEDVTPGQWYRLDFMDHLWCGPDYFRGVPDAPRETVFRAATWYTSDVVQKAIETEQGSLLGVGRLTLEGDLEFTVDGATDVALFEAVARADRDLSCE